MPIYRKIPKWVGDFSEESLLESVHEEDRQLRVNDLRHVKYRTIFKQFVVIHYAANMFRLYFGVIRLFALFPSHRIRLWLIVIECTQLALSTAIAKNNREKK